MSSVFLSLISILPEDECYEEWIQQQQNFLSLWSDTYNQQCQWYIVGSQKQFHQINEQQRSILMGSTQREGETNRLSLDFLICSQSDQNIYTHCANQCPNGNILFFPPGCSLSFELLHQLTSRVISDNQYIYPAVQVLLHPFPDYRTLIDTRTWLYDNSFTFSELASLSHSVSPQIEVLGQRVSQIENQCFGISAITAARKGHMSSPMTVTQINEAIYYGSQYAYCSLNRDPASPPICQQKDSSNLIVKHALSHVIVPQLSGFRREKSSWNKCLYEIFKPHTELYIGSPKGDTEEQLKQKINHAKGNVLVTIIPEFTEDFARATIVRNMLSQLKAITSIYIIENCLYSTRQIVPQAVGDMIKGRLSDIVFPFQSAPLEVSHVRPQGSMISHKGIADFIVSGEELLTAVDISPCKSKVVMTANSEILKRYSTPSLYADGGGV